METRHHHHMSYKFPFKELLGIQWRYPLYLQPLRFTINDLNEREISTVNLAKPFKFMSFFKLLHNGPLSYHLYPNLYYSWLGHQNIHTEILTKPPALMIPQSCNFPNLTLWICSHFLQVNKKSEMTWDAFGAYGTDYGALWERLIMIALRHTITHRPCCLINAANASCRSERW